jgi:peptide/nickel transport system permease protein
MTQYIVRRVLLMIPLLFGISLLSFAIIRLAPGDPARLLADPSMVTADQLEAARQELGLNDPPPVQYAKTMKALVTGELRSFKTRQRVIDMVSERLPTTLTIGGLAILIAIPLGIIVGVLQSLRPYSKLDDLGTLVSLFGFSVPTFWLALMLIMVFSVGLRWLPATGIRPPGSDRWDPREMLPYLVLPTFVLGSALIASVARYTRSSMLEALAQDYIRTARAKGLSEQLVVVRHALRNSLLPVITLVGFFLPFVVGGAVVTESIFALPGVGRLVLDSVFVRDYPVILSVNLMSATLVLVANLLADIGYAAADPRIRLG